MSAPLRLGLAVLSTAGAVLVSAFLRRKKRNPEDLERARRNLVYRDGRMVSGMVIDVTENTLYFSYCFRGMQYQASQDVSALRDRLPAEPSRLVGQATVRLLPANPSNSIVLAEEWSGLRSIKD